MITKRHIYKKRCCIQTPYFKGNKNEVFYYKKVAKYLYHEDGNNSSFAKDWGILLSLNSL